MSNLEVSLPANHFGDRLALDGTDIATHVRGFTLTHEAGRSRLMLDVPIHDVTRIDAANVEVMLPPTIAMLMEKSGWTPPPGTSSVLPRRADGCPCEWLGIGKDLAHPEPILGRIVPTCPKHGVYSEKVAAVREQAKPWSTPCGPCDYGVTTAPCACPEGDPRIVVCALLQLLDELTATTSGKAVR